MGFSPGKLIERVKGSFVGRLLSSYEENRIGLLATIVAYNALFSMFPIFLAMLALIGAVLQDTNLLEQAKRAIVGTMPPSIADSIVGVLEGTSRTAGILGLISIVGLFWSGSGLFGAIEIAMDQIYRAPERSFIKGKLMSAGMIVLFTVLVVVMLTAGSFAQAITTIAQNLPFIGPRLAPLLSIVGVFISLLAAFALCLSIFTIVPNVDLKPSAALPGALFSSVVLVILTQIFPLYVRFFGSGNQYGAAFGLFFLLMTYNYFVAQALLIGAIVNSLLRPTPSLINRHFLEPVKPREILSKTQTEKKEVTRVRLRRQ